MSELQEVLARRRKQQDLHNARGSSGDWHCSTTTNRDYVHSSVQSSSRSEMSSDLQAMLERRRRLSDSVSHGYDTSSLHAAAAFPVKKKKKREVAMALDFQAIMARRRRLMGDDDSNDDDDSDNDTANQNRCQPFGNSLRDRDDTSTTHNSDDNSSFYQEGLLAPAEVASSSESVDYTSSPVGARNQRGKNIVRKEKLGSRRKHRIMLLRTE
jgi:hypothetical protein